MALIKPKQKDNELLNDIKSFKSSTGFKIWWLAQSGFLIKWQEKYLLFDPYLSDSLSVKYQNSDKPHERISELVILPDQLDFIDIVTSSHNHTDHLDAETLMPIIQINAEIKFIIPEANRAFVVDRVNCSLNFPIGLNDGLSFEHKGFKITGIPAAHNKVERNQKGECKFMGFIAEFGGFSVYHSGDTLWFEGLEEILKSYKIDVAFLPINGNKPERKVAGNLSFQEAAELGKMADIKCIIPHHYHLFEFNTEDPQRFIEACEQYQTKHKVLEMGEGVIINK
jgi:L-ascorbate metabolism protein UlaG (beta-lactamase superfamily)